jgi:hypothetical protein
MLFLKIFFYRIYNAISLLADLVIHFFEEKLIQQDEPLRIQISTAFAPLKKCQLIGGSKKIIHKLDAITASCIVF